MTVNGRSSTRRRLWVLVWVIAGIVLAQRSEATPRERVQEALESYAQAQGMVDPSARKEGFRQSARLFEGVLDAVRPNADLLANLGAAALQGGDMGQAILAFRRALLLEPGHERSRTNLHYARGLLPSWVSRPAEVGGWDGFFSWWRMLSPAQQGTTGAIFFLLMAGSIAWGVRFAIPLVRNLAVIPGVIWLLILAQGLWGGEGQDHGVIIQEETMARAADSINAPASFIHPLPAGTEVRVMEQREGWTRIILANDRNTWIRSSALAWVRADEVK
ncbi:MAG: hypothetical protein HQL75_08710 [Magnetococcales bacterium]|nr:hypothetical protein [Magnetococcales bacterium]